MKSNTLNNGNSLFSNSTIKEISKKNQNSFRVKSLIEKKKSTENDKMLVDFARSKFEDKEDFE